MICNQIQNKFKPQHTTLILLQGYWPLLETDHYQQGGSTIYKKVGNLWAQFANYVILTITFNHFSNTLLQKHFTHCQYACIYFLNMFSYYLFSWIFFWLTWAIQSLSPIPLAKLCKVMEIKVTYKENNFKSLCCLRIIKCLTCWPTITSSLMNKIK